MRKIAVSLTLAPEKRIRPGSKARTATIAKDDPLLLRADADLRALFRRHAASSRPRPRP